MKNFKIFSYSSEEDNWVSFSDVMAGLMMVFLFIAVTYMIQIKKEKEGAVGIAIEYIDLKGDIYKDLDDEFKADLPHWNASIDRETLSIKFSEPSIYFDQNSAIIKQKFLNILEDFFPRYLKRLFPKYKDDIEEVRIEGHTSSEWENEIDPDKTYIENMRLSQDRARNVLHASLDVVKGPEKIWLIEHLTANGLSSSKLVKNENNIEDKTASRRVEFRVRTKTEERLNNISEK